MENAKKNLVFHFGDRRHATFPQKPVIKGTTHVLDNIFPKRPLCSLSVALPVLAALSAWPVFEASTHSPAMLMAVPWTAIIHTGHKLLIVSGSTEPYTVKTFQVFG